MNEGVNTQGSAGPMHMACGLSMLGSCPDSAAHQPHAGQPIGLVLVRPVVSQVNQKGQRSELFRSHDTQASAAARAVDAVVVPTSAA